MSFGSPRERSFVFVVKGVEKVRNFNAESFGIGKNATTFLGEGVYARKVHDRETKNAETPHDCGKFS